MNKPIYKAFKRSYILGEIKNPRLLITSNPGHVNIIKPKLMYRNESWVLILNQFFFFFF